jgi:hypothetical protein
VRSAASADTLGRLAIAATKTGIARKLGIWQKGLGVVVETVEADGNDVINPYNAE